jgi:hypothetical protein
LVEEGIAPAELSLYSLLTEDEARYIDELVERSGLTSPGILTPCSISSSKVWCVNFLMFFYKTAVESNWNERRPEARS